MANPRERRRALRTPKAAGIKISLWQTTGDLATLSATLVDVSTGGLGLLCPVEIVNGEYFVVTTGRDKYLYRSVRCWPEHGEFHVGAAREFSVGPDAEASHLNVIRYLLLLADRAA